MADVFHIADDVIMVGLSEKKLGPNRIVLNSVPVIRQVLAYKNGAKDSPYETFSDSNGDWEIPVVANNNDKFRVIIVGEDGEYSKIFENVVAG